MRLARKLKHMTYKIRMMHMDRLYIHRHAALLANKHKQTCCLHSPMIVVCVCVCFNCKWISLYVAWAFYILAKNCCTTATCSLIIEPMQFIEHMMVYIHTKWNTYTHNTTWLQSNKNRMRCTFSKFKEEMNLYSGRKCSLFFRL